MTDSPVEVKVEDDAVWLVFQNAARRNSLDVETRDIVLKALREYAAEAPPLVFISAVDKVFVSGADLRELRDRTLADTLARPSGALFQAVEDYPGPTIAAVDGAALGGGLELALACDIRIATVRSSWGLPEVRLGIVPNGGGLWRLPRAIGWGRASELIFTGRRFSAEEAERIGLLSVLTEDDLAEAVRRTLSELHKASPIAVRLAKEAMRVAGDRTRAVDALAQSYLVENGDARARMDAFLK